MQYENKHQDSKIFIAFDPRIPAVGIYPKEIILDTGKLKKMFCTKKLKCKSLSLFAMMEKWKITYIF